MAQSVRISDEFYDLALHASSALGRSLAQQIEYWARLGAALDAAGLTSAHAMELLSGDMDLKSSVEALLDSSVADAANEGRDESSRIAAKHRRLTQEVAEGKRSPQSLFVIPESIVRNAKMTFPKEHEGSKGW